MSSNISEICFLPATEMARRLRRHEISARELLDAHLEQIARVNPAVNAIVTLTADVAREQAERADQAAAKDEWLGPLHGLPIAHKDLQETQGIRTTFGSPIFENYIPDFNTLIVERARQAGAITVGKTNTPEFGAGSQTFNPIFGPTRNPWDLSKTVGAQVAEQPLPWRVGCSRWRTVLTWADPSATPPASVPSSDFGPPQDVCRMPRAVMPGMPCM